MGEPGTPKPGFSFKNGGGKMSLFYSRKSIEFWGFMAAAFVLFLLSTLFKTQDLKNILIVASAILLVIALLRLRRSS